MNYVTRSRTGDTHSVSPRASASGEVSSAGIPLDVSHAVVVSGSEILDSGRIPCTFLLALLRIEVEIPEFQLRLC